MAGGARSILLPALGASAGPSRVETRTEREFAYVWAMRTTLDLLVPPPVPEENLARGSLRLRYEDIAQDLSLIHISEPTRPY